MANVLYSEGDWLAVMDEFEVHVAEGGQIKSFWGKDGRPSYRQFYRKAAQDPKFAQRYRRALTFKALLRMEENDEILATLRDGNVTETRENEDGTVETRTRRMDMVDVKRFETIVKSNQWTVERENRAIFSQDPSKVADPLAVDEKLHERLNAADARAAALDKEKEREAIAIQKLKDEGVPHSRGA